MDSTLVSARVPAELAKRLEILAQTMHRSKSYLASQAIEDFVDLQEWHVKAIKDGIEAVERGDVVSHEQALSVLKSWGKSA